MNNSDILLMAEVVSREKSLDKDIIFEAIEAALATATRKRNRNNIEVRVAIERSTGDYEAFRQWEIIADDEEMINPDAQLVLSDARKHSEDLNIGDFIEEPMETIEFGRIAAQAAKQVIIQKVREAERNQVVIEFQKHLGELVSGTVKRMERDGAIVDINGVETLLKRSAMIPREALRKGDRIRALVNEINPEARGIQIFLDRISTRFLVELFKLEVPEASEGYLEIKSGARDPGSRAKVSVYSFDPKIDPIGACVGIRGARVQSVSNEIGGERVDIIQWSEDPAQFVINSLAPAEVESIVIDEDTHSIDVIVDESQLSQAIGKNGQNVKLATELCGWEINILTNDQALEKAEGEEAEARNKLMVLLDIDEEIAGILVQEGFTSLEEVAYVPKQELLDIDEFEEELVDVLRNRAEDALLIQSASVSAAEAEKDLMNLEGMDEETAAKLRANDVTDSEELAEFATDELLEILPELGEEKASALIMKAREPWFK